jgi:rhamnosyl/mannosyltransferase
VTVVRLRTHGVIWSQPVAPGYLAAARWPADVVYLHRPHPLADLAALLARARALVIFHHSDIQRQRSARKLYRPLAHAVARRARAAVVGAQANLAHADDLGAAGRAIARVIPFGVDETRFTPGRPAETPKPFTDGARAPTGLFVGRLVSYKGLDVLLEAVSGTALRMVIVGDGPLRAELEAEVERRALGGQVALVGEVSEPALPAYFQAADYLVLPSTSPAEMFGVAMVEAMACGKPVISTSLSSGVREVNVDGVTGLVVTPADHEQLRAAMLRLVGDEALRGKLGSAGRRRVEERFTLHGMVAAHLELCEELMVARSP